MKKIKLLILFTLFCLTSIAQTKEESQALIGAIINRPSISLYEEDTLSTEQSHVLKMFKKTSLNVGHLNFMGIPINGDISTFHTKILAKGFRTHVDVNKLLPAGIRTYNGTYAGYDSNLTVLYDPTSKIVYDVKVAINTDEVETRDSIYGRLKKAISKNYTNNVNYIYNDVLNTELYAILNNGGNGLIGRIQLYTNIKSLNENKASYLKTIDDYIIFIEYIDHNNYMAHMNNIMNYL